MQNQGNTPLRCKKPHAEKVVRRSVFLTVWHCILSSELIKTHSFRLFFLPTGHYLDLVCLTSLLSVQNAIRKLMVLKLDPDR